MRIAICDDEIKQKKEIQKYLQTFKEPEMEIINYSSGQELLDAIAQGEIFSLLFLDIRMEGLDGVETCRQIRQKDQKMKIIFMTSLLEYAIAGYELNVNDFLLKPITKENFRKVFARICKDTPKPEQTIYSIQSKGMRKALPPGNIQYIESYGRKLEIHEEHGSNEIYGNITKEEERLKDYGFTRIHRSYLVNLNAVDSILPTQLRLKTGTILPVSRSRYKKVYDAYTNAMIDKHL